MEVLRVLLRKDGIKYVIIPKKSKIKGREQIMVTNNLKIINRVLKEEKEYDRRKS